MIHVAERFHLVHLLDVDELRQRDRMIKEVVC